jgi:Uma2 family endonuclease
MSSWSPALAEPEPRTVALSIEEWSELPEDSPGEFVEGYLAEEEVPDPIHGLAVSWLIALFRAWLGPGNGFVFDSDVKFIVHASRGRKPDVSVYFPTRPPPPRRGPLREPPDVMVEVVSPSPRDERRDRVDKMDEYAAFGVSFYWLIDPALGSLEIFELQGSRFVRVVAMTEGRLDGVPGCKGLILDLDALWTELRRLSTDDRP